MTLKLFEAFSGYGGTSFALEKAKIPYECIGYSEIDRRAIKIYDLNFPNRNNFGDISKINVQKLPDFDLITAGFPCQDVSFAGKRDLSLGRTLLIEHIFRIIAVKKPSWVILENVKGLLSMKSLWNSIRYTLMKYGYNIYWKVLNSKDFGIPQNRKRVWIIATLMPVPFGKQIFPKKERLTLFLENLLQRDVDAKYVMSNKLKKTLIVKHNKKPSNNIARTLLASDYKKGFHVNFVFDKNKKDYRVLTPKEWFRLMGFLNDEIKTDGVSDTGLYHLAGNGWDINVASKLFKNLFDKRDEN
jgi:DNA (cytosine-5)-methyltransferase 1